MYDYDGNDGFYSVKINDFLFFWLENVILFELLIVVEDLYEQQWTSLMPRKWFLNVDQNWINWLKISLLKFVFLWHLNSIEKNLRFSFISVSNRNRNRISSLMSIVRTENVIWSSKIDSFLFCSGITLYCHQLDITSKVKADVQNISGELIVSGVRRIRFSFSFLQSISFRFVFLSSTARHRWSQQQKIWWTPSF